MPLFWIWASLMLSNIVWIAATSRDVDKLIERCYFQTIALVIVAILH